MKGRFHLESPFALPSGGGSHFFESERDRPRRGGQRGSEPSPKVQLLQKFPQFFVPARHPSVNQVSPPAAPVALARPSDGYPYPELSDSSRWLTGRGRFRLSGS